MYYEILGLKTGYIRLLKTYLSSPAEEQKKLEVKLGSKLLNLLVGFYLLVQKTYILDSVDYKVIHLGISIFITKDHTEWHFHIFLGILIFEFTILIPDLCKNI
jgi:hypothetical protein